MNNKLPYHISNSYVLRAPLLPLNHIIGIINNKNTNCIDLLPLFDNDIIKEAIFLASPDLYQRLLLWKNNEIKDSKEIEKLCISFFKYLLRMSSRCTPFGLFAGCSVGTFGDETKINLSGSEKFSRHTRLDMNYLCSLALDLAKIPEIKKGILFYPNSSIFISNNQIRYVEYKYINSTRNHFVIGVDDSPYLQKVLQKAQKGELICNLAETLTDEEVNIKEAKEFINELIEAQILISELEPSVSGEEFTKQLLEVLKKTASKTELYQSIESIDTLLKTIDNSTLGSKMEIYEDVKNIIKKLDTEFDEKFLFQTDLFLKSESNFLNKSIKDDLYLGIEILNKITDKYKNDSLENFKNNFYSRYEEEEIPLYEALDPEIGIGYGNKTNINSDINPLIEDLYLPQQASTSSSINLNSFQNLLYNKYMEAIANKSTEIQITDEDLKSFKTDWDDLPVTISTMVEIYKKEDTNDMYIKMDSAGGSSAVNLLGRFCHGNEEINKITKNITSYEKDFHKNVVLAEIVHLPESRTGNILLRPTLREYEIPYLAKSTLNQDFQLDITDLQISVPYGRFIQLRSKKLNKIILPRLSTAHNFKLNPLPIYEFLCDLQSQNLRNGINFNWGFLNSKAGFFPQIKYKNIILSLASWNIDKKEIGKFFKLKDTDLIKEITEWRSQKNIPAYVRFIQGDNELFLNLNNKLCIKTLFSLIKNQNLFRLKEFFFSKENSIVSAQNGYYSNQFIFHFFKN